MESSFLYVAGILIAIVVGGIAGYLIIVYLNPFPKERRRFRDRIEEIDKRLEEIEENPIIVLEAEIEKMNERIERLETIVLQEETPNQKS